ncbi:MAG: hypothetical protein K6G30_04990 [Acetatifactor sp.]|nr:hypothetical protein [Acetatifactor sp.]
MKKTPDYDDVFKTMKTKHKELFVPLINELYGTSYSVKDAIELLSSEGYVHFKLPDFTVIYVKSSAITPTATKVCFDFPSGESVRYENRNIILKDYSKEYIIEHKLYPYIPFYIVRYAKELSTEQDLEKVELDLAYLQKELTRLRIENELEDAAYNDMIDFIMIIIRHITNGNSSEERLVEMMGGTIFQTKTERDIEYGRTLGLEQGLEQGVIITCKDFGLSFDDTIARIMHQFSKSETDARELVGKYW